jgi:drug/metabolite transporter (DMT)-like permease
MTNNAPLTAAVKADMPLFGIALAILGSFCFVVQDSAMKWLTDELPVLQIIFLRSLFGIAYVLAYRGLRRRPVSLRVRRPWAMALRTAINVASWCLFFTGLKYLPLATATALFFSFPLFLTLLSVPLLGEAVGYRRWIAVVFGFAGVLVMTRPGIAFDWSMSFMLAAALGWSFVAIMTRRLGQTENATAMVFHTLVGFAVAMAIPQIWLWQPVAFEALVLLAGLTAFGVIAQLSIIRAYSVATPTVIAPFEYSGLIWAALFGYLIWGDLPDRWTATGAAMIVASGLYIVHREARKSRRPLASATRTALPPD